MHLHRWLARVDPRSASKIAAADRHRLERALEVWIVSGEPISTREAPSPSARTRPVCLIALQVPREALVTRLDGRVDRMYEQGLVEETRRLLDVYPPGARPFTAIGYAEAVQVVRGELPLEQARAETKRRTRAYAKRQMTWFRAERDVHWVDAARSPELILEESLGLIRRLCSPDPP
jgi:tRNA dimethylallyltransferase